MGYHEWFSFEFCGQGPNKKYTKLEHLWTSTVKIKLELVTKKVEEFFNTELSEKFGIMLDGWSEKSTSTQHLAIFSTHHFEGDETPEINLLAFSPLLDETSFSTQSQSLMTFLITRLEYLRKTSKLSCFCVATTAARIPH